MLKVYIMLKNGSFSSLLINLPISSHTRKTIIRCTNHPYHNLLIKPMHYSDVWSSSIKNTETNSKALEYISTQSGERILHASKLISFQVNINECCAKLLLLKLCKDLYYHSSFDKCLHCLWPQLVKEAGGYRKINRIPKT